MSGSHRPVYSIGAASKALGVPAATLRTWQDRYGVVLPERSNGGHRLYSQEQLDQLRFVAQQVAGGLSPADAHRLLGHRLSQAGELQAGSSGGGSSGRGRPLIMLAERDRYAAGFAEHFLRAEGYDVALELDADGALATSAELSPDLATVDLLISGGRGLELCRRLRARVPILAASTLDLRDAALEAGAAAFLRKPVEPPRLVSAVRDLLDRSTLRSRGGILGPSTAIT
jgi:DNA-binding transcriptional MerR regulator